MRHISDDTLSQMLGAITDPTMKTHINRIINSDVKQNIRCTSKKCKNAIIGTIDQNGVITPTFVNGKMRMRAHRKRLDGGLGFQCWCGNDSRLAEEEKGVRGIEQNAVTKADLAEVWNRLGGKVKDFSMNNGKKNIDGFIVEEAN